MGRTRLDKPKSFNPYSIGKEAYMKKTHRKTENEMWGCNEEERGRTRRRK
jgi:hypothetical protein